MAAYLKMIHSYILLADFHNISSHKFVISYTILYCYRIIKFKLTLMTSCRPVRPLRGGGGSWFCK